MSAEGDWSALWVRILLALGIFLVKVAALDCVATHSRFYFEEIRAFQAGTRLE
jgi:hypothetical protein